MSSTNIEFLPSVPMVAREHIANEVERLDRAIANCKSPAAIDRVTGDAAERVVRLEEFERQRRILLQYASDDRMRDVYVALAAICADDARWILFLEAGIHASDDFRFDRDEMNDLEAMHQELIAAATRLHVIMREMEEFASVEEGVPTYQKFTWNEELFGMPMRSTHHPDYGFRLHKWKPQRRGTERVQVLRPLDIVEDIERAAREWKPRFADDPAALALITQENTPRYQFIRSFWYHLTSRTWRWPIAPRRWEKSAALLKAIALVATIIRDDPGEVAYSSVKDALKDF